MEQEQHKKKSLKKKKNKSRKKSQLKKKQRSDGKVYQKKKRSQKKSQAKKRSDGRFLKKSSRKKSNNKNLTSTTKKKSKKMRGDGGYEDGVVTRKRAYEETIFDYIKHNSKKPLDEAIFREKMEKEANIQETDDEGNTVLTLLLQDKERAQSSGLIIKYLLEKGVDPNIRNEMRVNALIYAIRHISDDVDTLGQIISKSETNMIFREFRGKTNENEPIYRHSLTILMECFRCYNLEALKLILNKPTNPYVNIYLEDETNSGYTNSEEIGTLLMYIVRKYDKRMDPLLIELLKPEYGVDMSIKNKTTGLTAFLMAFNSQAPPPKNALHLCTLLLEHSHGRIDVNERVIEVDETERIKIKKLNGINIYVKKNNIYERILEKEKIFYTCALKLIFNRRMTNRVELLRLLLKHNVDVNAFFSEETYERTLVVDNEEFWRSKIVVEEQIIEEERVYIEKIVVTEKELSENSIEKRTTTNTSPLSLWRLNRYSEKEDLDFLKLLLSKDDVNVDNLFYHQGYVESSFLKIQLDLEASFSLYDEELRELRDEVLRLIIEKSTITTQFFLEKAVNNGYKSFANLLLQKNKGTSINEYTDFNVNYFFERFVNRGWANDEEMRDEDSMIQILLRHKPEEINKYVKNSNNILFLMMYTYRFKIFETLLRRNVSEINTREDEQTPTLLMKAVENKLGNHVRLLLELGANPNIRDKLGRTALFYISHSRKVGDEEDFLDLLCEVTNVNIRDNDNNTALMYIISKEKWNDFNFVNSFLKNETFDIDKVNNEGDTALFIFIKILLTLTRSKLPKTFIDMMYYYLKKIDKVNMIHRNRRGENLLSLLDNERFYEIYSEETDRELLKEIKKQLVEKLEEALLRKDADFLNKKDVYGRTELMNIAREKYVRPSVFKQLIENLPPDELNAVDDNGNTALMYSLVVKNYKEHEEKEKKTISYYKSLSYTEELMKKGANDEIRNIEGETMYDIAERLTKGESMEEIYGSNYSDEEKNPEKNRVLYLQNRERGVAVGKI